jgi:hypothetical protein
MRLGLHSKTAGRKENHGASSRLEEQAVGKQGRACCTQSRSPTHDEEPSKHAQEREKLLRQLYFSAARPTAHERYKSKPGGRLQTQEPTGEMNPWLAEELPQQDKTGDVV